MSNAPREYPDRPWVGIGCIVFREEAVLLVRRGKPPRIGQWSLPGGAQHVGEKAEEAARRELREETSIEVGPLALAYVFDAINQDEDGRARYHYTIKAPVNMCARKSRRGNKNGDTFLCRHFRFEARQLLSANLV